MKVRARSIRLEEVDISSEIVEADAVRFDEGVGEMWPDELEVREKRSDGVGVGFLKCTPMPAKVTPHHLRKNPQV